MLCTGVQQPPSRKTFRTPSYKLKIKITQMKRILLSLFAMASIAFAKAQTATPTTVIKTVIPFEQTDETPWITRYQKDITYYQKENKRLKDLSCDALFLGSSSINLWDTIYEDFAPLKLIRRSYGGATLRDMIYNYNTIAQGYKPKSIVLYVENDLGSHKRRRECRKVLRPFPYIHR